MAGSHGSVSLLEFKEVSIRFGGLKVIEGMNAQIGSGELVGLIGPNGAGKTTAFNLITGIYTPTVGDILFDGERLNELRPDEVNRRGIVRTFQNIRLFPGMTVLDNILVSAQKNCKYGLWATLLRNAEYRRAEKEFRDRAMTLLKIFSLDHLWDQEAASLPYGQQRKLEIVRALASEPKLILLDEPAAGMNHNETHDLMNLIHKVREQFKLTILLIEHDMKLVMGICEKIFVLDHGVVIAEGTPSQIQANPKVIEAYLGVEEV